MCLNIVNVICGFPVAFFIILFAQKLKVVGDEKQFPFAATNKYSRGYSAKLRFISSTSGSGSLKRFGPYFSTVLYCTRHNVSPIM